MELLRLEGVEKAYCAIKVAQDQSWSLKAGEALGAIGPNWAGKTSMFNLITGTILHNAGRRSISRGGRSPLGPRRGAAGRGSREACRGRSPSAP